jgi:hypothetical protein
MEVITSYKALVHMWTTWRYVLQDGNFSGIRLIIMGEKDTSETVT